MSEVRSDRSGTPPEGNGSSTRRDFLGRLAALCGGAITFFLTGLGITTFLSPAFGRRPPGWVKVGEVDTMADDLPKSVPVSFRRTDGWMTGTSRSVVHLTRGGNGEVVALSSTCTHLGCRVRWDRGTSSFLCPCHGGVYDASGQVTAGPPPRPLQRLETRVQDGVLYVRGEDLGA